MARLWQSGPHLNTATSDVEITTISGTVSISSTTVRLGPYSIRTNPSASTGFVRQIIFGTDQSSHVFARVYGRFASLPTGDMTILRIADSLNNPTVGLRYVLSTGGMVLTTATGAQVGSPSATINAGVWYRFELELDATSSPGSIAARIDGTTFAAGPNSSQTPWSRIVVGMISTGTSDANWCDLAVNDTSGTAQTSWPGSGAVIALSPFGAGDSNGWNNTSNGTGSSTNYTLAGENPPDDATTLVQTGTLNTVDMYAMSDSGIGAADTVNTVMVGLRLRNDTADATTAVKPQVIKASGGTVLQGSPVVPNTTTFRTNAATTPRNYPLITYTDPDGAAWTQATLDSMQAGIKLTTAGTNRIQVTTLWASVDYTPAPAVNPSPVRTVLQAATRASLF
jgi:hypothetical protein